jgi:hypothetical protein
MKTPSITYFKYRTHRPDIPNKSKFIPKELFYPEKLQSLNISHASTFRPFCSNIDRPTVGPTQPPVQWVPGGSLPGCGRDVKLTSHLHIVPRSRMVELYLHSPICIDSFTFTFVQ